LTLFGRLGELATAALLVSAGSGFVVAYQYDVAEPFVSSVAIEAVLPFGFFWRALHFWSSQAFFLILMVHAWESLDDLPRIAERPHGRRQWVMLTVTLPMAVFALFTGYVLRWDGTGQAAGAIAEHLILAVPLIGPGLNRFFLAASEEGLGRVYVVHLLVTALLWGIGTWYHTRKVILGWGPLRDVFIASAVVALIARSPMDLPGENVGLIKGPWFFLGVQELLKYLPPLFAGVVYPLMPVLFFAALPWTRDRWPLFWLLAFWGVSYGVSTLLIWLQ
jgi:quinol-cytochrome oxidoreductase complex cytochrome b subunit